jgi:hypothetical protein
MAYSEKLLTYLVQELNYVTRGAQRVDGLPTVGGALLNAKHRYYNTSTAGSLSNYDEKIVGQTTLYGLPMVAVRMPITTDVSPKDPSTEITGTLRWDYAPQQDQEIVTLFLNYTSKQGDSGTYYAITNQPGADVQVIGARPIQPRLSRNIHESDTIVHGVLMLGGAFTDTPNSDPVIARILGESVHTDSITEPTYSADHWHPSQIATVNRLLGSDWQSQDRLVVVPTQFMPDPVASTPTRTIGTQRRYTDLELEIYRAPIDATDYVAPKIWQVLANSSPTGTLKFQMQVEDDSGSVERTVVLYRQEGDYVWTRVELPYDAATGWAEGSVGQVSAPIYYFAQAVDPTGNVALALDHGKPFQRVGGSALIYLPLILRN